MHWLLGALCDKLRGDGCGQGHSGWVRDSARAQAAAVIETRKRRMVAAGAELIDAKQKLGPAFEIISSCRSLFSVGCIQAWNISEADDKQTG